MGITHVVRGEDHLSNTPAPADDPEGARRRAAASTPTCRCCTARTARSCPSATARRRSRSCATRLPARGGAQLPRPARLGLRRRDHVLHHRRADRGASRSSACPSSPAVFDEQKLRWMNGHYMRELDPASCARGSRTAAGRDDDLRARGGGRPGEDADPGRLLAAGGVPASSAGETDQKAWDKVMKDGATERAGGRPRGAGRRRAVRRESIEAALAAWWSGSGSSPSRSSSRCGWRSPAARVAGDLRVRRPAGPRRDARRASTPRWSALRTHA